jgi:hypothetical protein
MALSRDAIWFFRRKSGIVRIKEKGGPVSKAFN